MAILNFVPLIICLYIFNFKSLSQILWHFILPLLALVIVPRFVIVKFCLKAFLINAKVDFNLTANVYLFTINSKCEISNL